MRERNAATFGSFSDLFDFYAKEDPNRVASKRAIANRRASCCRSKRIVDIISNDKSDFYEKYRDKLKVADGMDAPAPVRAEGGLADSYMSIFLPGSPKAVRIAASMKAFDEFETGMKRKARRARGESGHEK